MATVPDVEHGPKPAIPALNLIPSSVIRQGDHPELPAPLPGILEGYLTIMAGAGGVGKTFLAEQIARHQSSGVQLGRFPLPEEEAHTWCLFLEDVAALTQQRSLDIAALGTLPEDQHGIDTGHDTLWYVDDALRGTASLRQRLHEAKEGGRLPELIVIDYLHLFIGPQPPGASPVDWERQKLTALRELGIEYGLHILVLTHMNKSGAVNGTAALLNACDTLFVVEAKDDRNYAVLRCLKMRLAPMTDYAISRKANGSWGFDDQVFVSEAMADGIMRDVLAVLRKEGPRTLSQLVMHPAIPGQRETIRKALGRGRKRRWVTTRAGHWQIVPTDGDTNLRPEEGPPAAPLLPGQELCTVCGLPVPTAFAVDGAHLTCAPAPVTEVDPEAWLTEPEPPTGFRALDLLKKSVSRSRYTPVPRVDLEKRDAAPWIHITETMGGEPRWERQEVPMGGVRLLLDRNGSYPSACSSVPLAPNRLVPTGPLEKYDRERAGIYLVETPEWPEIATMPHPLGKIVRHGDEQVWIATSHMKLLSKLVEAGRIEPVIIRDSHTGKANESLFESFYKEARKAREQLVEAGGDPYVQYKRAVSKALRLLWPKAAKSPFWRPDWRTAMVAEASVRHWLKADGAVRAGAVLLALKNVDEALYWTENGEMPPGYVEGTMFGQVKRKEIEE